MQIQNLAPSNNLQSDFPKGKSQAHQETLHSFVTRIANEIENEDLDARLARNERIYTNRNYYRNRQAGFYDKKLQKYIEGDDPEFRQLNITRPYVDKAVMDCQTSKPTYKVRPRVSDGSEDIASNAADELVAVIRDLLFTPDKVQKEWKSCKLDGEYYRFVFWNEAKGPLVPNMVTVEDEVTIPGKILCYDCATTSTLQGDPNEAICPDCSSGNIDVKPPLVTKIQRTEQQGMKPRGELDMHLVDGLEVSIPFGCDDFDELMYIKREREIPVEEVEWMFKDVKDFPSAGSMLNQALSMKRDLDLSPGANSFRPTQKASTTRKVLFQEIWLNPKKYFKWENPATERLDSGVVLEAGQKLIDFAPTGLYIARVNGKLIHLHHANKNDNWAMGVNITIPGTVHGDGIEDIIDLQDVTNDFHSLIVMFIERAVVPMLVFDQAAFGREELANVPGSAIAVNLSNLEKGIDGIIKAVQPGALDSIVLEYMQSVKREALETVHADSPSAGAPDVDNRTATAAKLINQASATLSSLPLAIRAFVDVRTLTQALKLIQKHWDGPRYLPVYGQFGSFKMKEFKKSDIPEDFLMVAVPGSWMPINADDEKNALMAGLQMGLLNPQDPDVQRYGYQALNIPLNIDKRSDDFILAEAKLAKVKLLVKSLKNKGIFDPQIAIQAMTETIPLKPLVDDAETGGKVVGQQCKQLEADESDPLLLAVLEVRLQQYLDLQIQQAKLKQGVDMASNPMAAMGAGTPEPSSSGDKQSGAGSNPDNKQPQS